MEEFAILIHGWFIPPCCPRGLWGHPPHKKIFPIVGGAMQTTGKIKIVPLNHLLYDMPKNIYNMTDDNMSCHPLK